MQNRFFPLALGLTLSLWAGSKGLAIEPTSVDQGSDVAWSQVVNNPFDGKLVYDKNFGNGFAFVSSWSWQGIRGTYTRYWSEVVGYQTVWRTRSIYDGYYRRRRTVYYQDQEPIYRNYSDPKSPQSILIALKDQVYTYDGGPVTPELATALASAPPGNVKIRLVWADGRTLDMEIGAGTVEAWKTIFQVSPTSPATIPTKTSPVNPPQKLNTNSATAIP